MATNPGTLIVQRFLPQYRLAFFQTLRAELERRGDHLAVAYCRPMGHVADPPWATKLRGVGLGLNLRALKDTVMLVPGIVPWMRREKPRVVVLEDVGGIPTNLIAARHCVSSGVPYLIWGLGRIPQKPPSRLRATLGPLIRWFYRNAAGFIAYSTHAARVYAEYGKPCHVALNASRTRPSDAEQGMTREAIDRRTGKGQLEVATIGRLLPQKRLDVLLQALRRRAQDAITLHVIGEGPAGPKLERLATQLGLVGSVVFHGATYDERRKAELLRGCDVGVLPGRGGLAIQEMMWHGLPVISGPADGTEQDLIGEDRGILIRRIPRPEDLAAALDSVASVGGERRRQMARNALSLVVQSANVEAMATSYADALQATAAAGSGQAG